MWSSSTRSSVIEQRATSASRSPIGCTLCGRPSDGRPHALRCCGPRPASLALTSAKRRPYSRRNSASFSAFSAVELAPAPVGVRMPANPVPRCRTRSPAADRALAEDGLGRNNCASRVTPSRRPAPGRSGRALVATSSEQDRGGQVEGHKPLRAGLVRTVKASTWSSPERAADVSRD